MDQLAGRFGKSRGTFGILVCREFDNKKRFLEGCRDTAKDDRGYIVALDDSDLKMLVEARKADSINYRTFPVVQSRFDALIS